MTNIDKNSIYKIERGVPIPSNRKRGKWVDLASRMNDYDSVVVKTPNECVNMRQAIIRKGKKSSARSFLNHETGTNFYRVWQVPVEWTRKG